MVSSVHEYISNLIGLGLAHGTPIWFRGQANHAWPLRPKLLRLKPHIVDAINYEKKTMASFRSNAVSLMQRVPSNDLEWFFAMQHYGVATRLLDWTENALTALYFAVSDPDYDAENAVVWVLEARKLNLMSRLPDVLHYTEATVLEVYNHASFERQGQLNAAIAIHADRDNVRMVAQQATFTISLQDYLPLDQVPNAPLHKIEIAAQEKQVIRDQLTQIGLTEFQLFPELAVLGKFLA